MLQLAKQDIEKNGLLEQYRLIHSPVQSIAEHMEEQVDLVMFHAVMEWLVDPKNGARDSIGTSKAGGHRISDVL